MNKVKEQVNKIGDHNIRRKFNKLVRMMQGGARQPTYRTLQGGARYSTGQEVRVGDVVRISVLDRSLLRRPGAGLPDDFDIDLSDPFLVISSYPGNGIAVWNVAIRTIRNRSSQEVHTVGYSGSNLEFLTRSQPKFEIGDIVQLDGGVLNNETLDIGFEAFEDGHPEGEILAGPRWRGRSFRGGPNLRWEYSVRVPYISEENYYLAEDELRRITTSSSTSSSSGTSSSTNGSTSSTNGNSSSSSTTTTTTTTTNEIVDLTNDIADELENSSSTTTTTKRKKKKKRSDGKTSIDFMTEQFAKQIDMLQTMYYTDKTNEKTHILWKYDKDDSRQAVNNNVNDINYNETIVEFSKSLLKGDIMLLYLGDLMEHMNLYMLEICGNLLTGGDYESLESIRGKIEDGFLKELKEKTKREKQQKLANDLEKLKKENEEKNNRMQKRKREEEEKDNKEREERMKKQRQVFLNRFNK